MKSNCEKKYFINLTLRYKHTRKNRIKENSFHGEGFIE